MASTNSKVIRSIPDHIMTALRQQAKATGQSQQDIILDILKAHFNHPAIVGWLEYKSVAVACVSCGNQGPMLAAGQTRDGKLVGPYCPNCAQIQTTTG